MAAELLVSFGTLKIEHSITIEPLPEVGAKIHGRLTFKTPDYTVSGENMSATMVVGSYATLGVTWLDENENPVMEKGQTSWSSSDPSTISVTVATGNSHISNVFATSAGTVTITASCDPGDGSTVTATIDITASTTAPPTSQATHGVITFSQYPSQIPPQRKR